MAKSKARGIAVQIPLNPDNPIWLTDLVFSNDGKTVLIEVQGRRGETKYSWEADLKYFRKAMALLGI